MEAVKPFIIGKELKEILVSGYAYGTETKNLPIIPIDHYLKKKKNSIAWQGYIVFIIGEEQLEMNLWAPWQYKLGLNTLHVDTISRRPSSHLIPITDSALRSVCLYDISDAYKEEYIGRKITNISAFGEDDKACEVIVIELENQKQIKICESCDEVYIEVI